MKCPVCGVSRYKRSYNHVYVDTMKKKNKKNTAIGPESVDDENDSDKEDNKKRKIPALMMWYLPVIDRLKRVFSNPKDAELVQFEMRPELHPISRPNGKYFLPLTSYTLTAEEKKTFCQCLCGVRVPMDFSSNISKLVSMNDLSIYGYNSHDCHVMMMVLSRHCNTCHQTGAC
jgi:hypothetical protein